MDPNNNPAESNNPLPSSSPQPEPTTPNPVDQSFAPPAFPATPAPSFISSGPITGSTTSTFDLSAAASSSPAPFTPQDSSTSVMNQTAVQPDLGTNVSGLTASAEPSLTQPSPQPGEASLPSSSFAWETSAPPPSGAQPVDLGGVGASSSAPVEQPEINLPTSVPETTPLAQTPPPTSFAQVQSLEVPPTLVTPEAAPTDLSHLVETLAPSNITTLGGETVPDLTVPQPQLNSQSVPEVTNSKSNNFPKAALIVGAVVLLLIVLGASAYFILGIGNSQETTSLPIEQAPLSNPPQAIIPVTPTPEPLGNYNTSLGSLSGATNSSQLSVPNGTSSAQTSPSALDLIKQRQSQQP